VETQDNLLKQFQSRERKGRKNGIEKRSAAERKVLKRKDTKRPAEAEDGMQSRIERAMQNAEEEATDEDEGGSENESFEGSEGEMSGEESGNNTEGYEDGEDSAMHLDDDEGYLNGRANLETSQANPKRNSQHLPRAVSRFHSRKCTPAARHCFTIESDSNNHF
jgi:hypothetical protein